MTGEISGLMRDRGIELPPLPAPIGTYAPFRIAGDILYLSGVGPRRLDGGIETGKVGDAVSTEAGYARARLCGLNSIAIMAEALGDLDRVAGILKVFGMVNAVPDFADHPKVIDGYTDLMVEVFGKAGKPARSAVGMGSLPRNISVEVEAIVHIRP
jgi:enamine deaminase RidA (YjgF/YER057c/UK114 family)